jgi:GntR family transcriptional regulator
MTPRLSIVPSSPTPIYRQIIDQVRAAIARGELAAGDPLPSVRGLAEELVVNMNTVAKAYGELVRHGDAVSEAGRGVFVSSKPPQTPEVERRRRLAQAVERVVAEAVHLSVDRDGLLLAIETYCDRNGVLPRMQVTRSGKGRA